MENYKTHVYYIISILVGIIILLTAVKWGKIEKLVEYITFALTLTSLVLALLAIIYAIFSNSKFTENITTLNNITNDVQKASSKLNDVAIDLNEKIELIPTSLKNVEEKTKETQDLVREMSLNSKKYKEEDNRPKESPTEKKNASKSDIILDLINFSSFTGKLVLLASNLSLKHTKSFSLKEIFNANENYISGFMVSLEAMGFIRYTRKDDIITVIYLNELIINKIEKTALSKAEENDKEKDLQKGDDLAWINDFSKVKDYFD
jgi:ABC-type multidrug transport system fused ATPase/permease subunit